MEPSIGLLRIRVINRFDAGNSEVTNDLPHLHGTRITSAAMQPGNPGSSALGSFTIHLHPPGSEGYAAAKPIYDQLRRHQRCEFYISPDGASLGKMFPGSGGAGIITGITKDYGENSNYTLTGVSDVGLANLSRPFPGELLSNDVTSAIVKSFLGSNELGWTDPFNPYTSGNYNSTTFGGGGVGTWTSTTDDNFNVVSCTTGSGAALVSKSGAAAPNDRWRGHFVEVTGRLKPSSDATDAGLVAIGMSTANNSTANSVDGRITARLVSGRYLLDCSVQIYVGGVLNTQQITTNALLNVDDPDGYIPLTLGLFVTRGGNAGAGATASLTVNGKLVIGQYPANFDLTVTTYPFIGFGIPTTGTATCYLTNLIQMTRFVADGSSPAALFGVGTISVATHSVAYGNDPGPTFLEVWTRLATREGWYWRYTPQAYVIGTRTIGVVDFAVDPGTDRTKSVIFRRRDGNLVGLQFNNNADPLAGDTALLGQSTLDGGGIGTWRDIATLTTYGVIQDETLSFTHSDFNTLRRAAYHVNANKIALDSLGAKTATVLRDPQFADTYRELDKITIDDPEMGVNMLAVRVMARVFTEGDPRETLILDQFSEMFMA